MYPWFTVISAVVQIGSTIFRSECSDTRKVFAPAVPQSVKAAAKKSAIVFREREAMSPPSPCGAMVPAGSPAPAAAAQQLPLYDWLFFSTFQNTGAGVVRTPSIFLRAAAGRYHWPRKRCVVTSVSRFL